MKTKSTKQLLLRLLSVMKHRLPAIGLAIAFAVMGFVMTVAIPVLLVRLTFVALAGESPRLISLGVLLLFALLRGIFRYGEHYFGHWVAFHTLADFRNMVFDKLRRLAPSKLDRTDSGQLIKLIGEDIEALEVFFAHTLAPIGTAIITTFVMIFYLGRYSLVNAGVAVITYFFLAVILPIFFAKVLTPKLAEQSQVRKAYTSNFLESLRGGSDLAQYQKTADTFQHLQTESQRVNKLECEVAQANFMQQAWTFLVVGLSILVVTIVSLTSVQNKNIELPNAVVMITAFSASFAPFLELSRLPLGFKRAMNAGQRVFELLEEIEPSAKGSVLQEKVTPIALHEISFAYDNRSQRVLNRVSVNFDQPVIIGIVGTSGAGKSTLVKLIMRWYDVTSGKIELSGIGINQLDRQSLQAHFAYVPQTAQIFNQTIRENLVLSNSNITDEAIWQVADKCDMTRRLQEAESGLDTVISPSQFSAGERQRLELMRALLKQTEIYIFDEPTSNLDALSEAAFIHIIKTYFTGTVFLISHRSSTVASADLIYEVKEGQLLRKH
ncbi:amino acid ABC transporter ATP-binding/permease protein [Streptococcus sciuri]|uniref:ABC transporter ATP-binding protein/permease n=1 Tax=Streptococcus sciuri TaxID=2973939 RepID=A0ABT2F5W8_9STRE|nr:ABC transporter ATP-binding protein [Streptococcus sciuri]MCS4487832.1 ABC transporter ATP-binding protein/permease [Streptococcus sciuri]